MPVAPRGAWLLAVLACCSSPAVAVAYGAPSFAVCLNGQTKRLELASKIEHVFVPNLQAGYRVEVFAHLDASPGPVKRTAWSTLQVDTFANCTERSLASALEAATLAALEASAGGRGRFRPANFAVHASFATPAATDYVYEIVGDKSFLPLGQDFGGADRRAFQGNFRMFAQMRRCLQLVGAREVRTRRHYDFVLRLRDDTLVFGPWLFDPGAYSGYFVDLPGSVGGWQGLNDHNFVVDRAHAEPFFRYLLEDYYLENPVSGTGRPLQLGGPGRNTEGMLAAAAQKYRVPTKFVSLCDMPVAPIRQLRGGAWEIDATYAELYDKEIAAKPALYKNCFLRDGLRRTAPLRPPDLPPGGGDVCAAG